ncbi:uncharacterized protein N7483_007675 [Penicillium malachiteum]|uniref:uncharacterized protein n=1 Tax=Penicillium malachiteum TaxID=1324776 RepID=UPI0025476F1C|nr:uncharacterized protein N7483_007675 [Penicillium malachiteum]KAJ5726318.1 hypothetical protein N7483_007675 [Penicillium malachiteum]
MAVIVKQRNPTGEACPMPGCRSDQVVSMSGGGTRCRLDTATVGGCERTRGDDDDNDDDDIFYPDAT